jgi:hypothetical protein
MMRLVRAVNGPARRRKHDAHRTKAVLRCSRRPERSTEGRLHSRPARRYARDDRTTLRANGIGKRL